MVELRTSAFAGVDGVVFNRSGISYSYTALLLDDSKPIRVIAAFEETAVEEGNGGEQLDDLIGGDGKELLVAVEVVDVVSIPIFDKAFIERKGSIGLAASIFAHALVECGEEEVLQDGVVIRARITLGIKVLENACQFSCVEERFGDVFVLFLEKPPIVSPQERPDGRRGCHRPRRKGHWYLGS